MARHHSLKMKVLREPTQSGDWIEAIIDGFWVQAKIFKQPSTFGINDGRVSKMAVVNGPSWDPKRLIINYDRGWDMGEHRPEVTSIVNQLEEYARKLSE